MFSQRGNVIRFQDWGYAKNCTLFAIANVPSGCVDCPAMDPRQSCELQIEVFSAPQAHNMVVLVYAEFENLLEIDFNRAMLDDITGN